MKDFQTYLKAATLAGLVAISACAPVEAPGAQSVDIPAAVKPREKMQGINEQYHPVTYIPLANDVLVPKPIKSDPLPDVFVGPFELRSETLAGALQLILSDYDIALAFQTDAGLTERITVSNLSGRLPEVVERVCALADLYCNYRNGLMTIKETETFVVDLPPIGDGSGSDDIASGLANVLESQAGPDVDVSEPIVDPTTNVIIYQASNRSARYAEEYFERVRKNTALIVFETNIWEVTLTDENRTGINWTAMVSSLGNFDIDITLPGGAPTGTAAPISISPSFNGSDDVTADAVFEFISEYGTVKTISQPQLTVLSGSEATLSVQNSTNYVSEVTRTVDDVGDETFSISTDTIDTGLSLTIGSGWDESTVYGTIDITLDELLNLQNFVGGDGTTVQLPNTTARALQTQVRVRPGDAVLIAGLVTESDTHNTSGPGFMKPLFPTSRLASTDMSELVFLFRPRVVVFETKDMRDRKALMEAAAAEDEIIVNNSGLSLGTIPADALAPIELNEPDPLILMQGDQ
tara:strand:+ start:1302 stop:2867 length:1566 start_codon:yes stop_codon:yes gene_type:complete